MEVACTRPGGIGVGCEVVVVVVVGGGGGLGCCCAGFNLPVGGLSLIGFKVEEQGIVRVRIGWGIGWWGG